MTENNANFDELFDAAATENDSTMQSLGITLDNILRAIIGQPKTQDPATIILPVGTTPATLQPANLMVLGALAIFVYMMVKK